MPEPGLPPSTGITRLHRYDEPLRLPQGPRLTISDHPGWWPRPTTSCGSHTLPRRPCLRMLTPLPRLERTGSLVGCSPAPRRPSPSGRRVGSNEKLSRPAQGSRAFPACAFAPRLHRRTSPEASAGRLLELGCSSGYRANRQFPGRDLHPLAFETQEVSLQSANSAHIRPPFVSHCRVSVEGEC